MKIAAVLLASALTLSGCLTSAGPRVAEPVVAPVDAPAEDGALAATIIAAMKGGLVGGAVGEGLGEAERRRALEAEYRALEYTPAGQAVTWGERGGRGGYGEVVAAQPYSVGSQNCRQYTQTVNAKGQSKTARGTACRNPDGSWTPLT